MATAPARHGPYLYDYPFVRLILLVLAFVAEVGAMFHVGAPVDLVATGLALLVLAFL
jgi:hypothetical protein